jgi:tetratricopeptide (TPR) repeat protein
MKKPSLLLILIVLVNAGFSQSEIVKYDEVTFDSELEKSVLDAHFLRKEAKPFSLFMANGKLLSEKSVKDSESRFYGHLESLKSEKMNAKRNDKKIKQVYESIHNTFLVKYEVENMFENIFHNGYYNCVSASALYALTFEELGIPFSLKEKPTHVYLIAYPDAERILIETTTPNAGYNVLPAAFKQAFVKTMKDQKLITAQEYSNRSTDELFDKFFFENQEDITVLELVGLQYYNDAVFLMGKQKNLEAFHQLEKAYLFYPSEKIHYLMMTAAQSAFAANEKKNLDHAECLGKLSRHKKYGITTEMIQGEYYRVIQDLLFEKGLKEKLKEYHTTLLEHIIDEPLKKDLEYIYQHEQGRLLYNQGRYKESLVFLQGCVTLKPTDQETLNFYIGCLTQGLKNVSNVDRIRELEAASTKQPTLLENNNFNELLAIAYLLEIRTSFDMNNLAEGEKFKTVFEKFVQAHKEVNYDRFLIGYAYSAAAVYYFRKGQTSKAKAIISKGLEFSPDNYELLSRRRMIQ